MTESLPPTGSEDETPRSSAAAEFSGKDTSARLAELESAVAQLKDQLLRKAAEFENYKRRVEGEYGNIVKFSTENLISRLLPVLDDFERFFKAGRDGNASQPATQAETSFHRGMELIHQKLLKLLEAQGLQHFSSVGTPFNPEFHDALLQMPNASVPPQTVIEEVEKGYKLHEKVLRHAKVIVSTDAGDDEPPSGVDLGVGD